MTKTISQRIALAGSSDPQDITTYGDEAVLAMQAVLLTFTNLRGDRFEQATSAVLNISTALSQEVQSTPRTPHGRQLDGRRHPRADRARHHHARLADFCAAPWPVFTPPLTHEKEGGTLFAR